MGGPDRLAEAAEPGRRRDASLHRAAQEADRHAGGGWVVEDAIGEADAVHVGEQAVDQHGVEAVAADPAQGVGAALRLDHGHPVALQGEADEGAHQRVVLDHQHAQRSGGGGHARMVRVTAGSCRADSLDPTYSHEMPYL